MSQGTQQEARYSCVLLRANSKTIEFWRTVKIQSSILQKKNTLERTKEKRNCAHLLTSLGFPYDESISWAISSC